MFLDKIKLWNAGKSNGQREIVPDIAFDEKKKGIIGVL